MNDYNNDDIVITDINEIMTYADAKSIMLLFIELQLKRKRIHIGWKMNIGTNNQSNNSTEVVIMNYQNSNFRTSI